MEPKVTLTKAEREHLVVRTRNRCLQALALYPDAEDDYSVTKKRDLNTALRKYPDRTHQLIDTYFNGIERSYERGFVAELIQDKRATRVINEFITYAPALLGPDNSQYETLILAILNGIRNYPQLPSMRDYSYADPRLKEQIMALLTATTMIEFGEIKHRFVAQVESKNEHPAYGITSDSLTLVLMERPEAAEQIANIVLEWQTDERELIFKVLDSKVPALRDGTL